MFLLLRKCRKLQLPVDIQLDFLIFQSNLFFNTVVKFGQQKKPIYLKKYICDSVNMYCKSTSQLVPAWFMANSA